MAQFQFRPGMVITWRYSGASVATSAPVSGSGAGTTGSPITGLTYGTIIPSGATAYASVTIGGVEQSPRIAYTTAGGPPSITPATSGAATESNYAASAGGPALATSSGFTIGSGAVVLTPTNTPAGPIVALKPISPTRNFSATFTGAPILYMCLAKSSVDEGTRQPFGGGELPPLVTLVAAGGSYTIRAYTATSGGSPVWESAAITVTVNTTLVGGPIIYDFSAIPSTWTGAGTVSANLPFSASTGWWTTNGTLPPDDGGTGQAAIISGPFSPGAWFQTNQCRVTTTPSAGTRFLWIKSTDGASNVSRGVSSAITV